MWSILLLMHVEFVSEEWRSSDVFNPSTGQVIHKVSLASRETVKRAIDSARTAIPAWRSTPPAKRAQVMFRY
ncbi:aldehyde dehydrogenase family protein, partial [Pseudomonas syringae group genomosp. 7]|uniref:aldehyde dehydrogenase family protein n=1 Tax=Pseudomonas syringae group genomosp. 7 TaxID=251699 RepID=UPI00377000A0